MKRFITRIVWGAKILFLIANSPIEIALNVLEWALWHARCGLNAISTSIVKSVYMDIDDQELYDSTWNQTIMHRSRVYLARSIKMMEFIVKKEDEAR